MQLYKVDSTNNTGTLIATYSVAITASDTAAHQFKYADLAQKVAISKNVYYRVAYSVYTGFDRLSPQANLAFPVSSSDKKVIITDGVFGTFKTFPNQKIGYLYTSDVKIQFP